MKTRMPVREFTLPRQTTFKTSRSNVGKALRTSFIFVAGFLVNLPLLNSLFASLRYTSDIGLGPYSLQQGLTWEHYSDVLRGVPYNFVPYFLNSMSMSVLAGMFVIVVALPAAYAIARKGFVGRGLLRFVASLRLLPGVFFVVPFFLLYSIVGLYDTVLGLALVSLFLNLPLGVLIFVSSIRGLPLEIEEAASVDGCSSFRILAQIVTPLLAPSIVAIAILTFVFSWSDYLFAFILTSERALTVTVASANFITSEGIEWGSLSAVTILSTVPPLIFAIIARRYLVNGLSVGAVKG